MKKIIFPILILLFISCGQRTDYFEDCNGDEDCIIQDYRELRDDILEDLEDGNQDGNWRPHMMRLNDVVGRLSFEKSEKIRPEILEISNQISKAYDRF